MFSFLNTDLRSDIQENQEKKCAARLQSTRQRNFDFPFLDTRRKGCIWPCGVYHQLVSVPSVTLIPSLRMCLLSTKKVLVKRPLYFNISHGCAIIASSEIR